MAIRDELKHFKKERILEEAERLFYERGFRGTSLDAIAESLDMTKPFIYGAYERKLDILVDLYERAMNRALDASRGAREARGTPASQRKPVRRSVRSQRSSASRPMKSPRSMSTKRPSPACQGFRLVSMSVP